MYTVNTHDAFIRSKKEKREKMNIHSVQNRKNEWEAGQSDDDAVTLKFAAETMEIDIERSTKKMMLDANVIWTLSVSIDLSYDFDAQIQIF